MPSEQSRVLEAAWDVIRAYRAQQEMPIRAKALHIAAKVKVLEKVLTQICGEVI